MNSDFSLGKMANARLLEMFLQLLEDDEFGLSAEDDSDFIGESV